MTSAPRVAQTLGPIWFRRLLVPVACAYLAELALGSNGWGLMGNVVPGGRFFTQGACLFPDAADTSIEYRVEAWSCARSRFEELDYRPDFPMHRDDKENRFYRAASFYRQNRQVMHALEGFLIARHNERIARGEEVSPAGQIGGIRLWSVRVPFPAPGQHVERYQYRALNDYPESYRKAWYYTSQTRRQRWCAGETP
ncbi:MAG TPA: hypothetical protein VNW92_22585 [Polyangiaceae bacterium]|jgi:hypothetical protein|nr:hypothetical protein [Polyangiaceae bacterium]